jgi:hypothetical protein
VPRGPADLVVGPAPSAGGSGAGGSGAAGGAASAAPAATDAPQAQAPAADIRDLAAHIGTTVQVGGLVTDLEAGGVRLDDGTGTARIVLEGEAAMLVALLNPGDAVTVTGTAEQRDEVVVVVTDPAALTLAGDPTAGDPTAGDPTAGDPAAAPEASPETTEAKAQASNSAFGAGAAFLRGTDGTPGPGAPALAGGTLALAALAGVVAAAANRGRERRRLRTRVLARLEALSTPDSAPGSPAEGS